MSRARQSMYPAPPPPTHWNALEQCSAALQASCANVRSAAGILDQGTMDLPRLATIVQSRRMFDLVTEPDVFAAQRALANEMSPQIEELISRAEDGLEGLKQRERALRARVDKRSAAASRPQASVTVSQDELDVLEQKLAQLQQRKERLGREVELLDEKGGAAAGRGAGTARGAGRPAVRGGRR
ncbi:Spc19p [Rhodotorula paludigena]|uniref:Spc19p n=1 Tax=Rhodotorula paludigena TaxID=86838 RepID=UPI003174B74B